MKLQGDKMFAKLRRYFLAGFLFILPTYLTVYIIWNIFFKIDNILSGFLKKYLYFTIPGLGFLIITILIISLGFFATNIIGKSFVKLWNRLLTRIPLINKIYTTIQQISEAIFSSNKSIFKGVVLVEYPRKYLYSLAFITNEAKGEIQTKTKETVVGVFIPTTPNPTSGMLIYVPREDIIILDMSVEDGMKAVISGGAYNPKQNNNNE